MSSGRSALRMIVAAMPMLLAAGAHGADDPRAAEVRPPAPVERDDDQPARPRYAPTSEYRQLDIEGWTVLVHRGLLQDEPHLAERTLTVLRHHLHDVERRVPAAAVAQLRTVRIWVELAEPNHACMAYHPDVGWLRRAGMNPDKARCVELANAQNFLRWTLHQPAMVLHELAHAYHHQFVPGGFNNRDIRQAYEAARRAGRYDTVLRSNGRREPAYALTTPMEYFAETAEAYFHANDFFPFNRAELAEHDPAALRLHQRLWRTAAAAAE